MQELDICSWCGCEDSLSEVEDDGEDICLCEECIKDFVSKLDYNR
jgi:hypothetical protein